jgi:uncharacterized membrane protein
MVSATTPISRAVATGQAAPGTAATEVNVGDVERYLCGAAGSLLTLFGLSRRSLPGLGLAALGGGLLYRAFSGHCPMYGALGFNTAQKHSRIAGVAAGRGVKVTCVVTVNRPADELYRRWRDLENLPHFMHHLVSVKVHGNRSHWIARAPAGLKAEWDAEIVNDEPGRLIAWRSLAGSTVATAGSVRFEPAPGNRGTKVSVTLKYDPPGGKLATWLTWLFGAEPGQQICDDLRRFKELVEAGDMSASRLS